MNYLLSAQSNKETIDFTKSNRYILDFLLNLGKNFKIESLDELRNSIMSYVQLQGLDYDITKIPYALVYEMYHKNLLTRILTEKKISLKKAPKEDPLVFEKYKFLLDVQERNPEMDLTEVFLKFTRKYTDIYGKQSRANFLKAYIYYNDRDRVLISSNSEDIIGEMVMNLIASKISIPTFTEIKDMHGMYGMDNELFQKMIKMYKRHQDLDFYKIIKDNLDISNTERLSEMEILNLDESAICNFFEGMTYEEVLNLILSERNIALSEKNIILTCDEYSMSNNYDFSDDEIIGFYRQFLSEDDTVSTFRVLGVLTNIMFRRQRYSLEERQAGKLLYSLVNQFAFDLKKKEYFYSEPEYSSPRFSFDGIEITFN